MGVTVGLACGCTRGRRAAVFGPFPSWALMAGRGPWAALHWHGLFKVGTCAVPAGHCQLHHWRPSSPVGLVAYPSQDLGLHLHLPGWRLQAARRPMMRSEGWARGCCTFRNLLPYLLLHRRLYLHAQIGKGESAPPVASCRATLRVKRLLLLLRRRQPCHTTALYSRVPTSRSKPSGTSCAMAAGCSNLLDMAAWCASMSGVGALADRAPAAQGAARRCASPRSCWASAPLLS